MNGQSATLEYLLGLCAGEVSGEHYVDLRHYIRVVIGSISRVRS
jgi:hypothetical protein